MPNCGSCCCGGAYWCCFDAMLLSCAAAAARFRGMACEASYRDMSCAMRVGDNDDACLTPRWSSNATPFFSFRLES